jgi:hypothetical protein
VVSAVRDYAAAQDTSGTLINSMPYNCYGLPKHPKEHAVRRVKLKSFAALSAFSMGKLAFIRGD